MADTKDVTETTTTPEPAAETPAGGGRFSDLDILQEEVARRIRDNQRFLDHLLDDDYSDEEETGEDESDPDDFEEL
jgi:hypothetical protein